MITATGVVCIALGLIAAVNQINMHFMRKTIAAQKRTIAAQETSIGMLKSFADDVIIARAGARFATVADVGYYMDWEAAEQEDFIRGMQWRKPN